jgi:hypothetical protein
MQCESFIQLLSGTAHVQSSLISGSARERAGAMGGARTGSPTARSVIVLVGWSNTTATSFMRPPHLSAALVTLEDIDFECAFEKLCPGDAFSFARSLFFI